MELMPLYRLSSRQQQVKTTTVTPHQQVVVLLLHQHQWLLKVRCQKPSSWPSNPSLVTYGTGDAEAILAKVNAQGQVVRDLKNAKSDATEAVATLLALKVCALFREFVPISLTVDGCRLSTRR